jgi:hypothetical protein
MLNGFILAQNFGLEQQKKMYDWFSKARKIRFWEVEDSADDEIKVAAACAEETQSSYYLFEHESNKYELIVSVSKRRGLVDCIVCNSEGGLAKALSDLTIVFGEAKETVDLKEGRCNFPLEFAKEGFCLADKRGNEIRMTES